MSGFCVMIIAIGYIIISGVVFGIVYAITNNDLKSTICGIFWPLLITTLLISITIALLHYFNYTKSIKNKRNEL